MSGLNQQLFLVDRILIARFAKKIGIESNILEGESSTFIKTINNRDTYLPNQELIKELEAVINKIIFEIFGDNVKIVVKISKDQFYYTFNFLKQSKESLACYDLLYWVENIVNAIFPQISQYVPALTVAKSIFYAESPFSFVVKTYDFTVDNSTISLYLPLYHTITVIIPVIAKTINITSNELMWNPKYDGVLLSEL